MKLTELRPVVHKLDNDFATLQFTCPQCGEPQRMALVMRRYHPSIYAEKYRVGHNHWLATDMDDLDKISLVPSVVLREHAPGVPCNFHGYIADGEVIFIRF